MINVEVYYKSFKSPDCIPLDFSISNVLPALETTFNLIHNFYGYELEWTGGINDYGQYYFEGECREFEIYVGLLGQHNIEFDLFCGNIETDKHGLFIITRIDTIVGTVIGNWLDAIKYMLVERNASEFAPIIEVSSVVDKITILDMKTNYHIQRLNL